MLPEAIESLDDLSGDWWVAHTKARNEKAFAWNLHEFRIPYFLPMLQGTAIWGGRKRTILKPLFASYVFFCGGEESRSRGMATGRLCQTIRVRQRDQFITELEYVRRALATDNELTFHPHAALGKRCRVKRGPLVGIEGVVIAASERCRIMLQVSMLGQGASLEIDPHLLESAE
jgi:hypothetical protein